MSVPRDPAKVDDLRRWRDSLGDPEALSDDLVAEWEELKRRASLVGEIPPIDECGVVPPHKNDRGQVGLMDMSTGDVYFVDDETKDGLLRLRPLTHLLEGQNP